MRFKPIKPPVEVSVVVPMFNEAESCAEFFAAIVPILEETTSSYEIVCIDDGSSDDTVARVKHARQTNPHIKLVSLSRNFGKESALTAGIDLAIGQSVIPIDADLQDPPELIRDMLKAWRGGAQVVLARRVDRGSDTMMKRLTSFWFYEVFAKLAKTKIPKDVGDFRLMDRVVVNALKKMPERSRFMKGLFAWVGYEQVTIDYVRNPRRAGQTKFNYWKLWNFALDGIFSFSSLPLKIWSYIGLFMSLFAASYTAFLIIRTMVTGVDTPGYASIMVTILFFNGIILISLGALGEYVSRIFIEVKQRPIYLIDEIEGFETDYPAEITRARGTATESDRTSTAADRSAAGASA